MVNLQKEGVMISTFFLFLYKIKREPLAGETCGIF